MLEKKCLNVHVVSIDSDHFANLCSMSRVFAFASQNIDWRNRSGFGNEGFGQAALTGVSLLFVV